jgi:hypothetical protein
MIVYLVSADIPDGNVTFERHRGRDVRRVTIPHGVAASGVGSRVLATFSEAERTAPAGLIESLIINTHGSPGIIHLGGITDDDYDINIDNVDDFTAPFRPLMKPMEAGGEGVEIHSCGVAAAHVDPITGEIDDGDRGFEFIYRLACGFGTRVRASGSDQIPDAEGLFEDTLVEATPGDESDSPRSHLVSVRDPRLLRPGGYLARVEAMLFLSMPDDPRDVHIRDDAREPRLPNR